MGNGYRRVGPADGCAEGESVRRATMPDKFKRYAAAKQTGMIEEGLEPVLGAIDGNAGISVISDGDCRPADYCGGCDPLDIGTSANALKEESESRARRSISPVSLDHAVGTSRAALGRPPG